MATLSTVKEVIPDTGGTFVVDEAVVEGHKFCSTGSLG